MERVGGSGTAGTSVAPPASCEGRDGGFITGAQGSSEPPDDVPTDGDQLGESEVREAQQGGAQSDPDEEEEHLSQPRQREQARRGAGSGTARLDAAAAAAKLAVAREKNRLAQQRFRERQRIKQKAAGEQCKIIAKDIERLERENEVLAVRTRMYVRVLAVRDAMLHTLTTLQQPGPPAQQGQQGAAAALPPGPAVAAAAQGLAQALAELPSEQEMEEAAPALRSDDIGAAGQPADMEQDCGQQAEQQQAEQEQLGDSSGSCLDGGSPAAQPRGLPGSGGAGQAGCDEGELSQRLSLSSVPQSVLGEAHRTGTAAVLDGRALQSVELIPPPSNQAVVAMIAGMSGPDDLLAFVHNWQAELRIVYEAGEAAGFDAASVAPVEAAIERMAEMWWHVGQLQPAWLSALACKAFPENSGQLPLWRELAAEVMPHINEKGFVLMRQSWHQYCKRLAKTAAGVSRWVRRLQEFTLQPLEAMPTHAAQSLELADIASHIQAAVQEEYIASMEFVAAQFPVASTLIKAYVNYRSSPWLPDLVALVYQLLDLHSQASHAGEEAGEPAAPAGAPGAHSLPVPLLRGARGAANASHPASQAV